MTWVDLCVATDQPIGDNQHGIVRKPYQALVRDVFRDAYHGKKPYTVRERSVIIGARATSTPDLTPCLRDSEITSVRSGPGARPAERPDSQEIYHRG